MAEFGCDRRTPTDTAAKLGVERFVTTLRLRRHEGDEERGRAAQQSRAVRRDSDGGLNGVEGVEQHQPHAGMQTRGEHGGASNVRYRKRDRVDVATGSPDDADDPC